MFDIGVTELLVIAVVAIVVVGPKELPRLLRTIGQVVSKAKSMAREFQNQFEEAIEETGVNKVREDFESLGDYSDDIAFDDALNPLKEIKEDLAQSLDVKDETAPAKKSKPKSVKKTAQIKKAKSSKSHKGASS